jgi:hypothetical protein
MAAPKTETEQRNQDFWDNLDAFATTNQKQLG